MIVQTIKNFFAFVGTSVISAVSWVVLSLISNILVGINYDVRRVAIIIISIVISLVISYFLGRSAGVNLTANGKFKLKEILIGCGIAISIYLLISLSIKGVDSHAISGIKAYIFNFAALFAQVSIEPFYGMCIVLPLVALARIVGLLSGNRIILLSRPSIAEATDFGDNGSFVDPDTKKKTWRDSVK